MPYIGKSPVSGGFHKLGNLTASATATYALTLNGAAYFPETANQLLVSLNGVIQAPQDSFTVSGSNLIFDSALTASDSIDFVVALGDVLGVGSVTDGAITTAKIGNSAVTKAKIGTTELDLATIKDSTGTNTAMTIDSSGRVALPNRPYAFVDFGGSAYASKTGGATLVFDNAIHNDGSHYNTGTGIFTCAVAGLYTVQCHLLSENVGDNYEAWLNQDGTTIARTYTANRALSFSYAIKCTASQTLALAISTTTNIYEGTGTSRYSFAAFTYIG